MTVKTGTVERTGKHILRFKKQFKKGSIICIGEEIGQYIIIKTIERGN